MTGQDALVAIHEWEERIRCIFEASREGSPSDRAGAIVAVGNAILESIDAGVELGLLTSSVREETVQQILGSCEPVSLSHKQLKDERRFVVAATAYILGDLDTSHQSRMLAAFQAAGEALRISPKAIEKSFGDHRRSGGPIWFDRVTCRFSSESFTDLEALLPRGRGAPRSTV